MRIRSIKPEFWRSDDISALEWDERLLFVGLWSYVDDNGVGVDKLSSIAADLFASDLERNPPETFARVSRGLQQLATAGRIVRYTVESRPYLEVVNWDKHQRIDRPNKPRFPRSEANGAEIRDNLASVAAKEASGTGEQGNRGTEEQGNSSLSSEPADADIRHDVESLLDLLDERIAANGGKMPNRTKKNRDAARLMIDADGLTDEQIRAAIVWATSDEFWRSNILSMSKLREKYEQLRLAAQRSGRRHEERPSAAQRAASLVGTFGTDQLALGGNEWT